IFVFAVVYIPHFSLQAALRHEPELWQTPVALVDPARNVPVVCAATETARLAGVEEGLTPTQAQARCDKVKIRHRSAAKEAKATEVILECAYSFSPNIEATAPGVCTLDLRGLSALREDVPNAAVAWAGQLRSALSKQNLRARVSIGPTPAVARQ